MNHLPPTTMPEALVWFGIALCVAQSAIFSGLNLAMFGLAPLALKIKAETGDEDAARVLAMRSDANFLLTTILWGNVGTNVLLTLLSDSVLVGASGFLFSTIVITLGGEIIPQAYFSRNALRMGRLLAPVLRVWQFLLYPMAKPTALMLDAWLGKEGFTFRSELEMRAALKRYIAVGSLSEISRVEGIGALNFLAIDDINVLEEGVTINPASIVHVDTDNGQPRLPEFEPRTDDPFLRRLEASGKKWIIMVDASDTPRAILDADGFLRQVLFSGDGSCLDRHWHVPIVIDDATASLEEVLVRLTVQREGAGDDVVDRDVALVWTGEQRRIITGSDMLGRLLRGISRTVDTPKTAIDDQAP